VINSHSRVTKGCAQNTGSRLHVQMKELSLIVTLQTSSALYVCTNLRLHVAEVAFILCTLTGMRMRVCWRRCLWGSGIKTIPSRYVRGYS